MALLSPLCVSMTLLLVLSVTAVHSQSQYRGIIHLPITVNNPTNILADGSCCNASETAPCTTSCNTRVTVCFRPPDYSLEEKNPSDCPLGRSDVGAGFGSEASPPLESVPTVYSSLQIYLRPYLRDSATTVSQSAIIDEFVVVVTYNTNVSTLQFQGDHGVANISLTMEVQNCTSCSTESTTALLVSTTDVQTATTALPVTTTDILTATTALPVSTTDEPTATTALPVTTTDVPTATTALPVSTTDEPAGISSGTTDNTVSTGVEAGLLKSHPVDVAKIVGGAVCGVLIVVLIVIIVIVVAAVLFQYRSKRRGTYKVQIAELTEQNSSDGSPKSGVLPIYATVNKEKMEEPTPLPPYYDIGEELFADGSSGFETGDDPESEATAEAERSIHEQYNCNSMILRSSEEGLSETVYNYSLKESAVTCDKDVEADRDSC